MLFRSFIVLSPFIAGVVQVQGKEITVTDPYANMSTPLRELMRGKHNGVSINALVVSHKKDFFETKFRNFEKLTGAKISSVETNTAKWYDDLKSDMGPGLIDSYMSFGNFLPELVEQHDGFLDITKNISSNTVGLDWNDIMPAIRNGVATYKDKIYSVPLDGDVILMLYRKDLVEDVGLPTPNTWDDVLKILEFYEDDENLYGNCLPTATNDISGEIFWSIASSFLQTKGTSEGVFFNASTMEPVSSGRREEFVKILDFYKKLVDNSPFRDENIAETKGVPWRTNMQHFNEGRCVLWYNYPGPTRFIISAQAANNMTGVLDLAPLPGMKCNTENTGECPYASADGANHAPFLASGGTCMAVNSRTTPEKQAAALDLAFYMSDPAVSFWDVAYPMSFLDPLRQRHTVSLGNTETKESQSFLSYGWEERQLLQLKKTTEFNFLHDNYVADLRILGAEEYREDGLVPHLLDHWTGSQTAGEVADAITNSWNLITEKYGLFQQRSFYRDILGLPPYTPPPPGLSSTAILSFALPITLVLIILLVIVMKQRHVIKYRTRDVDSAPKSGQVALLFTDVEGSTSLWDSSKSAMSKALEIHHDVIRECIDRHKAYEVKTIGDAFMIATSSADKACLLANDIQMKLLRADWPLELAAHPSSCVSYFIDSQKRRDNIYAAPKPMFKGLRTRIGIHMGVNDPNLDEGNEVQIMYDKVTKGYDYYGPVSNAAARIESLGFGGQTVISREVYSKLSENVKQRSSINPIGEMELRGVSFPVFVYSLLPLELRGRLFNGAYRKRDSTFESILESSADGEQTYKLIGDTYYEKDKTCDVYALTPVDLQKVTRRLQDRVFYLEHKLKNLSGADNINDSTTDRMMSEITFKSLANDDMDAIEGIDVNDSEMTTGEPSFVDNYKEIEPEG